MTEAIAVTKTTVMKAHQCTAEDAYRMTIVGPSNTQTTASIIVVTKAAATQIHQNTASGADPITIVGMLIPLWTKAVAASISTVTLTNQKNATPVNSIPIVQHSTHLHVDVADIRLAMQSNHRNAGKKVVNQTLSAF